MLIRWAQFLGENRAKHPRLLPDGIGTGSSDQFPGRGDLRPVKYPFTVASVPYGSKTVYRMGRDTPNASQYWLAWNTVVHPVRGYDASDTTERTYYTGDGAPKVTDNTMALTTPPFPTASRPLGIPAPASAPTVIASGGSSTVMETYFYVYTYVNDWGWESAPSAPSTALNAKVDATRTVSAFAAAPAGNYQITKLRIYRTQTGTSGTTDFYFHSEVAYGTSSVADTGQALGEVLATTTWLPAPGVPMVGSGTAEQTLTNLTAMWNGMLAGICGNSVRVCEAYVPYAWPQAYDIVPPDSKPIALAVIGQNLLVLTTGRPLLVSGSSPDSLDQRPVEFAQACASSQSVVAMGSRVLWASEEGLCEFSLGDAPRILTANAMNKAAWQSLLPQTIVGAMAEGMYLGSCGNDLGTGLGANSGFLLDPNSPDGIFFQGWGYRVCRYDELLDQLYVASSGTVQEWNSRYTGSPQMSATSKLFTSPRPVNMAVAEVIADAYPVTFSLYGDGVLRHTQTVTDPNPFWLPSGYMASDWKLQLSGTNAIQSAAVATSMAELGQV
jgi:hypothetical protein